MASEERWLELQRLDAWLKTPMMALTLAWLVILLIELTSEASPWLLTAGTIIWAVFVIEFLVRFALAPEKTAFLKRNWLTVLALAVPALRLFRAVRVLRAARLLRGFRLVRVVGTINRGMNALREGLRRRGFNYVVALTLLVLLVGAAGMRNFEPAIDIEGGFESYPEALWWTGMLIASLGTDFWPQTTEGRILSAFLALYGLAVFGYVTATFATFFLGKEEQPSSAEPVEKRLSDELSGLRLQIAELGAELRRWEDRAASHI